MSSQLTWLASEQAVRRERRALDARLGRRRSSAAAPRKRRGQGERRPNALARAGAAARRARNSSASRGDARAPARQRDERGAQRSRSSGDAVELHAVVDEAEAELLGDPPLQRLELLVDELDDLAGLDVDQMVVMGVATPLRSASGRRRNRGARGCPPPRTGARCGRRWRSRCSGSIAAARACSVSTSGWSSASPSTRAIVRRCSVMRRPLSAHKRFDIDLAVHAPLVRRAAQSGRHERSGEAPFAAAARRFASRLTCALPVACGAWCRGRSSWPACGAVRHSWARPSDSRR